MSFRSRGRKTHIHQKRIILSIIKTPALSLPQLFVDLRFTFQHCPRRLQSRLADSFQLDIAACTCLNAFILTCPYSWFLCVSKLYLCFQRYCIAGLTYLVRPRNTPNDGCTFTSSLILREIGFLLGEFRLEIEEGCGTDSFRLCFALMGHEAVQWWWFG